eukprot:3842082-Amphidinium_carterae.1
MKAHQTQAAVDCGMVTAVDLHGNGQADELANCCSWFTWTRWADFASKVFHSWRLLGPQLRVRPDSEPRVRLPGEALKTVQILALLEWCTLKRLSNLDRICVLCDTLPFCIASTADERQARLKESTTSPTSRLKQQDCRGLKKKNVKVRHAGFFKARCPENWPRCCAPH